MIFSHRYWGPMLLAIMGWGTILTGLWRNGMLVRLPRQQTFSKDQVTSYVAFFFMAVGRHSIDPVLRGTLSPPPEELLRTPSIHSEARKMRSFSKNNPRCSICSFGSLCPMFLSCTISLGHRRKTELDIWMLLF